MTHARCIACFLKVHVEIDQIDENLRMRLRLHGAAHDAEAEPRLAVFRNERRNDGVEGPLARFEHVRVAVLQTEQRAAILQLVENNNCQTVAFDLTGVQIVPSGILGLWASLNQADIKVEVYNPSDDIREVLEITRLNQLIEVKEVEL